MVAAALPLAKVLGLTIRTVAKPLSKLVKARRAGRGGGTGVAPRLSTLGLRRTAEPISPAVSAAPRWPVLTCPTSLLWSYRRRTRQCGIRCGATRW